MLRGERLVEAAELDHLNALGQSTGGALADLVVGAGLIEETQLLAKVAEWTGCEFGADLPAEISGEVIALLTPTLARSYGALPFRAAPGRIDLLVADPFRPDLADELAFVLGKNVRLFLADPWETEERIRRYYGDGGATWDEVAGGLDASEFAVDESALKPHDLEAMAGQPPVIRFVNGVLGRAIRDHASDIHF